MDFNKCKVLINSANSRKNLKKSWIKLGIFTRDQLSKEGARLGFFSKDQFEKTGKSGSLSPLLSTSRTVSSLFESINDKNHPKQFLVTSKTISKVKNLKSSTSRFNPKVLKPILSSRRGQKDQNSPKSPEVSKKTLKSPRKTFSKDLKFISKNNDFLLKPEDMLKSSNPEFNESDDPVFLSARISNDCESNQSLRIQLKKLENFSNFLENDSTSAVSDRFTQTDDLKLDFGDLDQLEDEEVLKGIQFISKLSDFLKTN